MNDPEIIPFKVIPPLDYPLKTQTSYGYFQVTSEGEFVMKLDKEPWSFIVSPGRREVNFLFTSWTYSS